MKNKLNLYSLKKLSNISLQSLLYTLFGNILKIQLFCTIQIKVHIQSRTIQFSFSIKFPTQMKSQHQQFLSKYNYNKDKPILSTSNFTTFNATIKDSALPVTIKTLKYPHLQLGPYLKKIKECKSQNVIKIYDLLIQQQTILIVTEQIIYGNLKKALQKCKYLDQPDAIFIAKQILSAHVDLLRSDLNWFGTEEDIQFAQDGQIKLSWNNGCSFNLVNPIPAIIGKFSKRSYEEGPNSILPFPISKSLQELMRISKQNASEIGMNPQMKKKDKLPKRKGKNWIAIKQYKNKNEYFDELTYFGIHSQWGFIKVKVYESGKISPNLLQLNKTKSSFIKIHQVYDQNNKSILLSDYSNDGNLQSYVLRLKTAGIKLKEDQIQFFVYSLLQPIKMVQESSLKAVCMLHIKNIYIESGIPKIGEPVPLNQKINEVLIDRKDVPDFYHPEFKSDPTQRQQKFDTYSLGVLLYKLMYTEMPIFPQAGKVHIPTAPSYNKRLKQAIQLFLTQSAPIKEIEQKIEMSDHVKKQIEDNKQKLKQAKESQNEEMRVKGQKQANQSQEDQQHFYQQEQSSSQDEKGQLKEEEQDDEDEGPGYCDQVVRRLRLREPKKVDSEKRYAFVDQLQLSSFKNFRLWSKTVILLLLYFFLFYYQFIQNSILLLSSQSLLTKIDLTVENKNVSVVSTDRYEFERVFNQTGKTISELQNMHCLIEDSFSGNKYSSFLRQDSEVWYGYLFGGLAGALLILLFKVIQIHVFDDINAWFRKQDGQGYFNLWNWILLNYHWLGLISGHYFLFNFAYQPQTQPCIGHRKGHQWGSTNALFNDHSAFIAPYVVVFGIQVLVFTCYLILVVKNNQMTQKYNKAINTLTIFGSILIVVWFIIRFGIIFKSFYYPAGITDRNNVIVEEIRERNYVLLFGILPEILFLIQLALISLVNWIYYIFVDKTQSLLNNEANLDASLKDIV